MNNNNNNNNNNKVILSNASAILARVQKYFYRAFIRRPTEAMVLCTKTFMGERAK